jgi:hypothetical protein
MFSILIFIGHGPPSALAGDLDFDFECTNRTMSDFSNQRFSACYSAIPNKELYSSSRSMDSVASKTLVSGSGPNMIGVGIFFQQETDGKVYAKTVFSGGSAERDGFSFSVSIQVFPQTE